MQRTTAKLQPASALFPNRLDLDAQIAHVNRQVATQLVQTGEAMARNGDYAGADAKFKAALALNPPADTPVYVWIEAGTLQWGQQMKINELPMTKSPHTPLLWMDSGSGVPKLRMHSIFAVSKLESVTYHQTIIGMRVLTWLTIQ